MSQPRHTLTILSVTDLPQAAAFYRCAFGWVVAVEVPVYVEFTLPGGQRLGVYQAQGFALNTGAAPAQPPLTGTTGTELYFHVDDLDQAEADLLAAGATLLAARASKPWGDTAAYYADPFGNVLVLAQEQAPA